MDSPRDCPGAHVGLMDEVEKASDQSYNQGENLRHDNGENRAADFLVTDNCTRQERCEDDSRETTNESTTARATSTEHVIEDTPIAASERGEALASHRHQLESQSNKIAWTPESWTSCGMAWVWEIVSCTLAVLLLVAQFVFLGVYNGKVSTAWTAPIGLNTLVAVLSTVSRVSLVFVIGEIISQVQWSRMQAGPVPLHDTEAFNKASRGAWASLKLLVHGKIYWKRPDLIVALIVGLVSLGMGAFAQQAVQMAECRSIAPGVRASLPIIRTMGNLQSIRMIPSDSSLNRYDGAAHLAIISSILNPFGNHSALAPVCPTGNCTFPSMQDSNGFHFTHRSIAFCSRCYDLSSQQINFTHFVNDSSSLFRNASNWNLQRWSLHSGLNLTSEFQSDPLTHEVVFMQYLDFFISSRYRMKSHDETLEQALQRSVPAEFYHSFINVEILSINEANARTPLTVLDPGNLSASATLCSLYPCRKSYFASISGGQLLEQVVSSEMLTTYSYASLYNETLFSPSDAVTVASPCLSNGQIFTSDNISSAPGSITLSRWHVDSASGENIQINITAPPECLYAIELEGTFVESLRALLEQGLDGLCTILATSLSGSDYACISESTDNLMDKRMPAFWLQGLAHLPRRSRSELGPYFDAIAESLTRYLRKGVFDDRTRKLPGNEWRAEAEKEVVLGTVWRTALCIEVNFTWLILPTAATALTILVLAWTIWRGIAKGEVAWKSSVLPLVYYQNRIVTVHQQDEALGYPRPKEEPLVSDQTLEEDSKKVRVRFTLYPA